MIVIVDYGMGNLNSIRYKLEQANFEVKISSDSSVISKASKLILPGVGHFRTAMKNIKRFGLTEVLSEQVLTKRKPILGICLGFQLLFEHSEEGDCKGFGWIEGSVKKFFFNKNDSKKIPHVGWNTISVLKKDLLFKDISRDQRFYFTHSYFVNCNSSSTLSSTYYGIDFVSVARKNNIVGTQFHPEKSHKSGFKLLKNFCEHDE